MKRTGVVWDPLFIEHLKGAEGHPESPRRLQTIYRRMKESGLDRKLITQPVKPATEKDILLNHSETYFKQVRETQGEKFVALDSDTWLTARSYEAAVAAAGSGIGLVDDILDGKIDNGFLLVRPPGHHALYQRGMGFCLFNNIAVAAEHLIQRRGLKRVAIVDFDVHHGNGTQDSFYQRPDVLYCSTHQSYHFPGTGYPNEIGYGEGTGFTVNVPLLPGAGDQDYCLVYQNVIVKVVEEYRPEILLVSAGYDIHQEDPLSGMTVSTEGCGRIAEMMVKVAEAACGGKVAFFLEGGYHLEALGESVLLSLRLLLGEDLHLPECDFSLKGSVAEEVMAQGRQHLAPYWKCMKDLQI